MLADSNIFIYALKPDGRRFLRFIYERLPVVSAITLVEVLGTTHLHPTDMRRMRELFERLTILPLDAAVLDRAIALRQQRRMGLADALIAATALAYGRILVTRNTADFAWVPDLRMVDPFTAEAE